MKAVMKQKTFGYGLLVLAAVLAVVSAVYYILWARANFALNTIVVLGLGVGFALNLLLLFLDSDFLVVLLTALYSSALLQLLVDSAGSFADAYQGIVMFGDPTQVGTILTIGAIIAGSVVAVILSGFLGRRKVSRV